MVKRTPQDTLGRRNRMKPQSTGKRIRLTKRDLLWMQAIHHHGPLSTSELLAFSGGGEQNKGRAQNRLTDLFNETDTPHGAAYLTRPPQQFETIDARYNELIYGLTKAGEQALKDLVGRSGTSERLPKSLQALKSTASTVMTRITF